MKYILKAIGFMYINLIFFNVVHNNVLKKNVIKNKIKELPHKKIDFYFIAKKKKINKNLFLRKNSKNSYLNQNRNYEIKEKIDLDIDRKTYDNKIFYKKENILNNKKIKLISQVLNRTKLFDLKFFSPAKINFFLRLKEEKKDYNEISTLMHSISLGDDIFITMLNKEDQKKLRDVLYPCSSGDFLTINKNRACATRHNRVYIKKKKKLYYKNYPLNDDNIIIKILKRYREELKINDDIKFLIHTKKRTPILGGLGGGSSNGATVFYFLEKYFYKYLKLNELKNDFLKKVGSDISFFNSSGFAYCTGRGNDVIDLKDFSPKVLKERIYLFQFNGGLSSKLVYENVNYNKIVQYSPISLLKHIINFNNNIIELVEEKEKKYLNSFVNFESNELQNVFINDLEHSAFFFEKKLKEIKEFLINQNFFEVVIMSGSGSTLFALPKNDIYLDLEKIKIKNLIKTLKEKLNVRVKVYLCNILRKNENFWYKPNNGIDTIK